MSLLVKYYGMLADIAGKSEEVWMEEGLTVGKFRALVFDRYPQMREKKFKIAVNQKISDDYVPVDFGAEIALLPPFAGG